MKVEERCNQTSQSWAQEKTMGSHEITQHLHQMEHLLRALENSPSHVARCNVLKLFLIAFDHHDKLAHDKELEVGADIILSTFLRRAASIDIKSRETNRICRLLEMVYRCSDSAAMSSMCNYGAIIMPLLVTVAASSKAVYSSRAAAASVLDRLKSVEIPLTRVKDSDLLMISLVRFLRSSSVDCQRYAMTALECITVHGESKPMVGRFPGMLESVIQAGKVCYCEFVAVLENLLRSPANRKLFVETKGSLELLLILLRRKEPNVTSRACGCLEYLASETTSKEVLVTFQSGEFVSQITSLLHETLPGISTKLLQSLSNLLCQRTVSRICMTAGLIELLGNIACKSVSSESRKVASKILKRISTHIHTRHERHQAFCDALRIACESSDGNVSLWIARAYVEQSLHATNSFFILRSESTFDGLLILVRSKQGKVRATATEALANLAQECANARRLSNNEKALSLLVETLCAWNDENDDTSKAQREAVRAILLMTNHGQASKRVAKHVGLVQALARYGTSVDGDIELKRAALHGVLVLATSM